MSIAIKSAFRGIFFMRPIQLICLLGVLLFSFGAHGRNHLYIGAIVGAEHHKAKLSENIALLQARESYQMDAASWGIQSSRYYEHSRAFLTLLISEPEEIQTQESAAPPLSHDEFKKNYQIMLGGEYLFGAHAHRLGVGGFISATSYNLQTNYQNTSEQTTLKLKAYQPGLSISYLYNIHDAWIVDVGIRAAFFESESKKYENQPRYELKNNAGLYLSLNYKIG